MYSTHLLWVDLQFTDLNLFGKTIAICTFYTSHETPCMTQPFVVSKGLRLKLFACQFPSVFVKHDDTHSHKVNHMS